MKKILLLTIYLALNCCVYFLNFRTGYTTVEPRLTVELKATLNFDPKFFCF